MMKRRNILLGLLFLVLASGTFIFSKKDNAADDRFISNIVDPKNQELKFYWKDGENKNIGSILRLKSWVENNKQQLVFAMNGGMYKSDHSPQGLYIENQKELSSIDTSGGKGNFYLMPNGIFYITTDNIPVICNSTYFNKDDKIKYATQSGPMLIVDGKIHPAFIENSANLHIRNGVGILPGNKVVFAMSKKEINFYDLAMFFKKLGCKNALYLDGFVSRTYLPEKQWTQTDGNFGVIIAVSKPE